MPRDLRHAAAILATHGDDVEIIADALRRTGRIGGADLMTIWHAGR